MDPPISTNSQSLSYAGLYPDPAAESVYARLQATEAEVTTTWTDYGPNGYYSSGVDTSLGNWASLGVARTQTITESMPASCPATLTVQHPDATLCVYDQTGGFTPVYGTTITTTNLPGLSPTATGVVITYLPLSTSRLSSVSSSVAVSSAATSSAVISTAATSGGLNTYVKAGTGINAVFGFLTVLIALSSFLNLG